MAVFRVDKTRDYTVMANHHLRNKELSLKAKGLLSLMLSLPDNWDYTTKGLAHICKDGVDSICATVKELEQHGYVIRHRVRNDKGQLTVTEYTILEQPKRENPVLENPTLGLPEQAYPEQAKPKQEKPAQLNIDITSKEKPITDLSITDISNPYQSSPLTPARGAGYDGMGYEEAKETVKENIEYDCLVSDPRQSRERLDEVVDLIAETLCSRKQYIVIAGDEYPAELVKEKLLKINASHIEYVFDCLNQNTTYVRNIKKYLLASLFNAPSTIDSYYTTLVNHDMYGDGRRGK